MLANHSGGKVYLPRQVGGTIVMNFRLIPQFGNTVAYSLRALLQLVVNKSAGLMKILALLMRAELMGRPGTAQMRGLTETDSSEHLLYPRKN